MTAVGIVTLGGDTNFGNRLQNFALQETLSSLGVQTVESIHGVPRGEVRSVKAQRLALTAFSRRKELFGRLRGRSLSEGKDLYSCPPERRQAIGEFSETFIRSAPSSFREMDRGAGGVGRYSHFVVGSDQVWNPAFTHANPEWFLSFAPKGRRIAYAASFGVPRVPRYVAGRFRKGLRGLAAVSVREHQASSMVRELADMDAPVVLDPTMLIETERWEGLARVPRRLSMGGYIATFMLSAGDGMHGPRADLRSVIDFGRRKGLELVDLHDPVDPDLLAMGPLEFIGAIKGSELVVTDSFHTAVFSVLFHRPFLLVERGAMNSRFETLLSHVGLKHRLLSQIADLGDAADVDWDQVDGRLAGVREESLRFLSSSLGLSA